MAQLKTRALECAAATLVLPGQEACGDQHIITDLPNSTLVGAVDGLGHGEEAAKAAERAIREIGRYGTSASLPQLIRRCDRALRDTRGAAVSLAEFSAEEPRLSWLGVGNVAGWLIRKTVRARSSHRTGRDPAPNYSAGPISLSRNAGTIAESTSTWNGAVTCDAPGWIASCERGNPAGRSPKTSPPTRRKNRIA
jgi:ADP-ribose pyrophosphatase YjhB (NUDIX family)